MHATARPRGRRRRGRDRPCGRAAAPPRGRRRRRGDRPQRIPRDGLDQPRQRRRQSAVHDAGEHRVLPVHDRRSSAQLHELCRRASWVPRCRLPVPDRDRRRRDRIAAELGAAAVARCRCPMAFGRRRHRHRAVRQGGRAGGRDVLRRRWSHRPARGGERAVERVSASRAPRCSSTPRCSA